MSSVEARAIDLGQDDDDVEDQPQRTLRDRILQLAVPHGWTREAQDPPGELRASSCLSVGYSWLQLSA